MLSSKKFTCKWTVRQVFIRVYRLEIQSVMLVFSTEFCELLPLPQPSLQKLLDHPKQNLGEEGGLRQINTCRKVPLQVNFLDDDILLWCLYS